MTRKVILEPPGPRPAVIMVTTAGRGLGEKKKCEALCEGENFLNKTCHQKVVLGKKQSCLTSGNPSSRMMC